MVRGEHVPDLRCRAACANETVDIGIEVQLNHRVGVGSQAIMAQARRWGASALPQGLRKRTEFSEVPEDGRSILTSCLLTSGRSPRLPGESLVERLPQKLDVVLVNAESLVCRAASELILQIADFGKTLLQR